MIRLNLLPPDIKEERKYSRKNAKIYEGIVRGAAIVLTLLVMMFIIGFIVWNNRNIARESRNDASKQVSNMKEVEVTATDIYSRLQLISKLKSDRINWNKVLSELAAQTPASVKLVNIDFTNADKDRVNLAGFASASADVGIFRDQLSKTTLFQYIDLESVSAATDPADKAKNGVSFRITLTLNMNEAKK